MFKFFKKNNALKIEERENDFEIDLIGSVLAYEVARSDGDIDQEELSRLLEEIKKISIRVGKSKEDILNLIEIYSNDSVSFYEFIEDINTNFNKEDKLAMISFLWEVAYADSKLDVDEERLIRRIADLIRIKDVDVLKLKDKAKAKD
ncbi:TerB family tellurite resistance protein [Gammaproteobacteria bacterium]|nr:TerB family tellurite resistance protein [Gammaproteobacteria bacterium]